MLGHARQRPADEWLGRDGLRNSGGRQSGLPPQAGQGVCPITGMRKREPQVQHTCKAGLAQKAL